jgi:Tfp pilus assembly protein PilP
MNKSRRFEVWISSILVVVCLLLSGFVRQFRKGPSRKLIVADLAGSVSVAEHPPTSSREHHGPRRVEAVGSSNAAPKSRPLDRVARHPFASEQEKRIVSMPPAEAHLQTVAPPQPRTITLEPLGYVEKADGRVEAIISLGERVQVVHEGEIFEDKFRVAKISSSAVELVENSASPAQSQFRAEAGQGVAQMAADKARQTNSPPVPEQVSNTGAGRQRVAAPAASGSQPSVRQALGYVERADGRVEAIIADGEHVRLSQASKSFAKEFHGPVASSAYVELAEAPLSATGPPDSSGLEPQLLQTNPPDQEVGGQPSPVSGIETSTLHEPQGIPENNRESEAEQLGVIQPEALADYTGGGREMNTPRAIASTLPTVGPTLPSDGKGGHSAVNTLGYVEKADGEKEAIVEVFGQVYLVHEGELFAEKYRAVQVTSSSVQIVEDSTEGSSLPSEIGRDSEAVRAPISRLRVPPLSTGSSGTDLPAEVRKAGGLAAGEPPSARQGLHRNTQVSPGKDRKE